MDIVVGKRSKRLLVYCPGRRDAGGGPALEAAFLPEIKLLPPDSEIPVVLDLGEVPSADK